jgi:hypothetical protein
MDLSLACDHASNDHCDFDNVVDTLERATESYRVTDWQATFARGHCHAASGLLETLHLVFSSSGRLMREISLNSCSHLLLLSQKVAGHLR